MRHPRGTWLNPDTGSVLEREGFMRAMAQKQVVLLGESHDVAEIHRWQMHTANYLHAFRSTMLMGFEMFPVKYQPALDAWCAGELSTANFLERVAWDATWGFPPELYLPLFHFCRQNGVPMIALNCRRELVTQVGKDGWDAVPEDERDGLTPSAPPKDGYHEYLQGLMSGGKGMGIEVADRFIRAQQTWDRAFACTIDKALQKYGKEYLVIGIIGRGHLEYGFGTRYQLASLGVNDVAVLLPSNDPICDVSVVKGIGEGIYRLDSVEPVAERKQKARA